VSADPLADGWSMESGCQPAALVFAHTRASAHFDFMVPVRRSGAVAELATRPWNRFGYGIEFDKTGRAGDLQIDFEAIAMHLGYLQKAARAHGLEIDRVIFAPEFLPELFRTRAARRIKDDVPFFRRPVWIRHDEHYHVDFRAAAIS
jgi:penicillin-insensitive murein endopeptidase